MTKTPGRGIANHPRQQAGGRGRGEGSNTIDRREIGGVTKKRKSEGPELVVQG